MTNPVLHEQTGMITRWIMGFGHEVTSKSKAPWLSRWAIISAYFSSSSTPTARRPRFRAATSVEPEPANGSAITPGGQAVISSSMTSSGLVCGWPVAVMYPLYPDAAFHVVAITALRVGVWSGQSPRMKIGSQFLSHGFLDPNSPAFSGFSKTSILSQFLGYLACSDPNTIAGCAPHCCSALSLAPVVSSFCIPTFAPGVLLFAQSPLLHPIPYGGSVTSTSASSHSVSSRQSPWYSVTWSSW